MHSARLSHTQHVEKLQDQLLDILEGILLCCQVWVDLLLYLKVTEKQISVRYGKNLSVTIMWSDIIFHSVRQKKRKEKKNPNMLLALLT